MSNQSIINSYHETLGDVADQRDRRFSACMQTNAARRGQLSGIPAFRSPSKSRSLYAIQAGLSAKDIWNVLS